MKRFLDVPKLTIRELIPLTIVALIGQQMGNACMNWFKVVLIPHKTKN
jgi:hypothetical protein